MFFERVFREAATVDVKSAYVLADAARNAYQKALSEGLPLAHIAEQTGRPQYWFANNILHVVEVHGQRTGEAAHTLLSRDLIAELKLADDISGLVVPDTGATEFTDLRITKDQIERYMAWARTVY